MRQLIKTDGTITDLPDTRLTMRAIHELIGAESLDFVSLKHMGNPLHVMALDDNGYETNLEKTEGGGIALYHLATAKPRRPVNALATELYQRNCRPGTNHQIVGDVVIVPDEDFADPEPPARKHR